MNHVQNKIELQESPEDIEHILPAKEKRNGHPYYKQPNSCNTDHPAIRWRHSCHIRGMLEKYPSFGREKKHKHTWSAGNLIELKVVSLWLHTLLSAVSLLLETFRESLFRNVVWLTCRCSLTVLFCLKSLSFQRPLEFGEQPQVAGSGLTVCGVQHVLWNFNSKFLLLRRQQLWHEFAAMSESSVRRLHFGN